MVTDAPARLLQPCHSPLNGRYHRLTPFVGCIVGCLDSSASILASRSSVSLFLRSCSMALSRVFMSWLATAARPVSSSPASTSLTRSCSCVLIEGSSRLGLLLPAFEAALRRLSAFAGSCHQQNR